MTGPLPDPRRADEMEMERRFWELWSVMKRLSGRRQWDVVKYARFPAAQEEGREG